MDGGSHTQGYGQLLILSQFTSLLPKFGADNGRLINSLDKNGHILVLDTSHQLTDSLRWWSLEQEDKWPNDTVAYIQVRQLDPWSRGEALLVECRTSTRLKTVCFLGVARAFSPTVNFQCRLSYSSYKQPLCASACIKICVRIKDPHWQPYLCCSFETKKHPVHY